MSLILELTPTEEESLAAAAHYAGVAPLDLIKRFVDSLSTTDSVSSIEDTHKSELLPDVDGRADAIRAARGSLSHLGASVDDLHRQRQVDKAAENRQVQELSR